MCTADSRATGVVVLCFTLGITGAPAAQTAASPVPEPLRRLSMMKTLCVDAFAGDPRSAATVREMVFAGLFAGHTFTVTERCDKADAVLKGAILERATSRVRAEGEGTDFGVARGGMVRDGTAAAAAVGALAGGQSETLFTADQGHTAAVVLRIVDGDGVVLWAHAQESPGGKHRGATGDAVDRALKQLARDLMRARTASP